MSFIKYLADFIIFYLDTILGIRDIKDKNNFFFKEWSFHSKEVTIYTTVLKFEHTYESHGDHD